MGMVRKDIVISTGSCHMFMGVADRWGRGGLDPAPSRSGLDNHLIKGIKSNIVFSRCLVVDRIKIAT
jgi:hypothetical protein